MLERASLSSLIQDLKYAVRTLRKAPGFVGASVLTLGLAIGASTAVFTVVNGILLRPLQYPEADRIAMVWRVSPISAAFRSRDFPWGPLDSALFLEQSKSFESLGVFQAETFNLTGTGEPAFLEGVRASAGFFPALGIAPAFGRFYTAEEDRPGHEHVTILSDRLWRERFGADRTILGRTINLNGFGYTVVGIMPPGFSFPHAEEMPTILEFPREAQLWVPRAMALGERGPSELAMVGRMRRHTTIAQVQAELEVFSGTLQRLFPNAKEWSKSTAVPLEKQIVGDTRRPLLLLLGAVGLVLLIACSNVAGLVVTRSLGRHREFDLRAALGAGRGRLISQLVTESLLLATVGGIFGIALAEAGIQLLKGVGPASLPRLQEVSLDLVVVVFCGGITLLTGLLFGLAPIVGTDGSRLADSLKGGVRIAGNQFSQFRNALLVGQVAIAFVLVVAAGLLSRTFYGLLDSDGGFKAERVLTFEISLPSAKYPDPVRMAQLYSRALRVLSALPGVEAAGLAHAVPLGGAPDGTSIRVPGRSPKPDEQPYANYMFASPGYFATVRTPLLRGREFAETDTLDSIPVTIVNRAMANALWPGEDAIGKQVGVASTKFPLRTVVGIVANVKQNSLREDIAPQMYVPFTQNEIKIWPPMRTMQAALRTSADPANMTAALREAMRSVDPDLPLAKVATLTNLVDRSLTQPRFAMLLVAGFGALAFALACIGMYGVISHSVTQRTQEIGIRIALGANGATVFRMILGHGARLVGTGIGLGLIGALGVTRIMSSFLYGVRATDPLTFGVVSVLLGMVALLACYMPARHATRVDPMIALRHD